jgi:hypothetical protein
MRQIGAQILCFEFCRAIFETVSLLAIFQNLHLIPFFPNRRLEQELDPTVVSCQDQFMSFFYVTQHRHKYSYMNESLTHMNIRTHILPL